MNTGRTSPGVRGSFIITGLALSGALLLGLGCKCGDPGKIDVPPDCPGGIQAASSIQVQFDLRNINDVGVDKQIRVSGNRQPNQDNCFAPGSQPTITPAVTISGQGTGSQAIPNLQHGNWQVTVQVIGGSSNPPPPQVVNGNLAPGSAHTLNITGGSGGSLQVTF